MMYGEFIIGLSFAVIAGGLVFGMSFFDIVRDCRRDAARKKSDVRSKVNTAFAALFPEI